MSLTAILARSDDGIIGVQGPDGPTLPWRLPPDLKRFRELTTGHAVIMGRRTYDSIGRPLPNRTNIVVSRTSRGIPGCAVSTSPEEAVRYAMSVDPSPFLIGGAELYEALWQDVTRIELTEVHTLVGLGTVFYMHAPFWREVYRSEEQSHDGLRFHFVTLERKAPDHG